MHLLAHRDAWYMAGVLHRDISVNNIMILELEDSDIVGMLCDWDLCKYKEQMGTGKRTPDRVVRFIFLLVLFLSFRFRSSSGNTAGNVAVPVSTISTISFETVLLIG